MPRLRSTLPHAGNRPRWMMRLGALTTASLAALAALLAPALPASAAGTIVGVDVSHYQGSPTWSTVKASGQMFAITKATEGQTYTDTTFSANYSGIAATGMIRGAYHFARPDTGANDAVLEADHFIAVAGTFAGAGKLAPVLDLEANGGLSSSALITWTHDFLNEVQRLTGRTPIIYTGPSFWQTSMANSTAFTTYPLWIAHYTTASSPTIPGGWANYTFWQYTSSATIDGISGSVDHNRFRGTSAALNALANSSGVTGLVNTAGGTLNIRSGPGTGYTATGTVSDGQIVTITCQITGTSVTGTYGTSTWWDKLSSGGYITDSYVLTGSASRVAPAC